MEPGELSRLLEKNREEGSVPNLRGADFTSADLSQFNLFQADLTDAKMSGAILRETILSAANLERADLSGAVIELANLDGANLAGACLLGANLSGADLWGATLDEADLTDASLQGAILARASLWKANLTGVNLDGTTLEGVNLEEAEGILIAGPIGGDLMYGVRRRGGMMIRTGTLWLHIEDAKAHWKGIDKTKLEGLALVKKMAALAGWTIDEKGGRKKKPGNPARQSIPPAFRS